MPKGKQGFQKGHPQLNTGRTRFKKGTPKELLTIAKRIIISLVLGLLWISSASAADLLISQTDFSTGVMTYVGDVTNDEWRAGQKIVLTSTIIIEEIRFYASVDNGSPTGNIEVRFETDSSGPSNTLVDANATKEVAVTGGGAERTATFTSSFQVEPGTYYIALRCDNQATGVRWGIGGDTTSPSYAFADAYSTDGGSGLSVKVSCPV